MRSVLILLIACISIKIIYAQLPELSCAEGFEQHAKTDVNNEIDLNFWGNRTRTANTNTPGLSLTLDRWVIGDTIEESLLRPSNRGLLGNRGCAISDIEFTYTDIPDHDQLYIAYYFYTIDSWNGNRGDCGGNNDRHRLIYEGTFTNDRTTLFDSTFCLDPSQCCVDQGACALDPQEQCYPEQYPCDNNASRLGTGAIDAGSWVDQGDGYRVYKIETTFESVEKRSFYKFKVTDSGLDGGDKWGMGDVILCHKKSGNEEPSNPNSIFILIGISMSIILCGLGVAYIGGVFTPSSIVGSNNGSMGSTGSRSTGSRKKQSSRNDSSLVHGANATLSSGNSGGVGRSGWDDDATSLGSMLTDRSDSNLIPVSSSSHPPGVSTVPVKKYAGLNPNNPHFSINSKQAPFISVNSNQTDFLDTNNPYEGDDGNYIVGDEE